MSGPYDPPAAPVRPVPEPLSTAEEQMVAYAHGTGLPKLVVGLIMALLSLLPMLVALLALETDDEFDPTWLLVLALHLLVLTTAAGLTAAGILGLRASIHQPRCAGRAVRAELWSWWLLLLTWWAALLATGLAVLVGWVW